VSDDRKILGWRVPAPTPIYEVERGWIATAAFVLCCQCNRPIRSMGGPMLDAWCVPCFDAAVATQEDAR